MGSFLVQNNIPVFCPALTDGSLGDMLYLHSYRNPGLRVDIVEGDARVVLSWGAGNVQCRDCVH